MLSANTQRVAQGKRKKKKKSLGEEQADSNRLKQKCRIVNIGTQGWVGCGRERWRRERQREKKGKEDLVCVCGGGHLPLPKRKKETENAI